MVVSLIAWASAAIRKGWLYSLGILLVSTSLGAEPLLLNPSIERVYLGPYMQVLEDPERQFRLAEVFSRSADDWKYIDEKAFNVGFTDKAYWFRIQLDHFESQKQRWYLNLHNAQIEQLQVALISEGRYLLNVTLGNQFPFATKLIHEGNFIIPLDLPSVSSATLILRISAKDASVRFNPELLRSEAYIQSQDHISLFYGACFGTLTLLMLLNLSLFIGTRDTTYFSYSIFIGLFALWQFQTHGFAYEYLWPEYPTWERFSPIALIILMLLAALEFSSRFLEMHRKKSPLLTPYKVLAGVILVVAVASWPLPTRLAYQISLVLFLPTLALIIYSAIESIKQYPPSKMFLLAWGIMLISTLMFIGVEVGWIEPTAISNHVMIAGALIQAFMLSLAVASRISHLRYSKNLAKEQIVRARATAKAKSDLLAVMSHEIRTPLNGVMGFVQLLEDTQLNPEQKQYVRTMKDSGKALLEVINSVLDFAKIEAGKMQLEQIDCKLQDLLDDTLSLFAHQAREYEVEFYGLCKPNVPSTVRADPTRLRQILINLLGNAFKFTTSGEIRLTIEVIKRDKELLLFKVRDTGIGIRPEVQEILFESFSQADNSTTRQFGGTGLGLNICKKLVELMGGHIGVISEENKGSTFWFTVPLVHSQTQETRWLMGQQVYILGDGEHVEERAILGGFFEQWGAHITHIGDIERLTQMDGAEVLVLFGQAALSHHVWLKIKHFAPKPTLICIPDYNQESEVAPGNNVVIRKPFTARNIRSAIEHGRQVDHQINSEKVLSNAAAALRILVAEDNPVNRMILMGLLEKAGVKADTVENGRQAVEQFQLHPYDVLLLDCEMPEMDGYEAALRIRLLEQIEEREPSQIIAVSAHAFDEHIQRCRLSGMDEHLAKPINKEALYRLLNQIASSRDKSPPEPDANETASKQA